MTTETKNARLRRIAAETKKQNNKVKAQTKKERIQAEFDKVKARAEKPAEPQGD